MDKHGNPGFSTIRTSLVGSNHVRPTLLIVSLLVLSISRISLFCLLCLSPVTFGKGQISNVFASSSRLHVSTPQLNNEMNFPEERKSGLARFSFHFTTLRG